MNWVKLLVALVVALPLDGCITSARYKLAKPGGPAPTTLDLRDASSPLLEVDLQHVIVYHDPGSWKRNARWDEYQLVLVNRGNQPVVIQSVLLIDTLGAAQAPGDDPWKLEQLSRSNWDRYGKTGLAVVAGAGAAAAYTAGVVAAASSWAFIGAVLTPTLIAIPVLAIADVSAVATLNERNKHAVETEFQRRRLSLPLTITPGASVTGSLFFPMTPGPRQLIVEGRAGELAVHTALALDPISSLHLKAPAAAAGAPAQSTYSPAARSPTPDPSG